MKKYYLILLLIFLSINSNAIATEYYQTYNPCTGISQTVILSDDYLNQSVSSCTAYWVRKVEWIPAKFITVYENNQFTRVVSAKGHYFVKDMWSNKVKGTLHIEKSSSNTKNTGLKIQ